mgnify:CR=1 FL=1
MGSEASANSTLCNILSKENVLAKVSVKDWIEAIKVAGSLLLKKGCAEPRYIDAMINYCKQYNAYIVIAPGIAMPHARPENGAKNICISIITLEKPVKFGHPENDPVSIVIAFTAVDKKSHLGVLQELAELLADGNTVKGIKNAKSNDELLSIIKNKVCY